MTTRLQTAELCLRMAWFKAKRGHSMPTKADARDLLAELGVNGAQRVAKPRMIETDAELEACKPATVIRDSECRVLELLNGEWLMTGEETPTEIDLPARVLYTPEDES